VAPIEELRNVYRILAGKYVGTRSLGRPTNALVWRC